MNEEYKQDLIEWLTDIYGLRRDLINEIGRVIDRLEEKNVDEMSVLKDITQICKESFQLNNEMKRVFDSFVHEIGNNSDNDSE